MTPPRSTLAAIERALRAELESGRVRLQESKMIAYSAVCHVGHPTTGRALISVDVRWIGLFRGALHELLHHTYRKEWSRWGGEVEEILVGALEVALLEHVGSSKKRVKAWGALIDAHLNREVA